MTSAWWTTMGTYYARRCRGVGATRGEYIPRMLELRIATALSPCAFAWLLVRGLRRARQNLGTELELARGIAWLALIPLRARRARTSGRPDFDASCPAPTPETLGMGRLTR